MRYVLARYGQYQREETYRIYVTDSLRCAYKLTVRYADVFKPEEKRTADDIKKSISDKLAAMGGE